MRFSEHDIVTDEEIERVHANANFGDRDKREVVNDGVLHVAGGWHMGSTMTVIVLEHGLARRGKVRPMLLTKKGRDYLFTILRNAVHVKWSNHTTTKLR